MQGSFLYRKTNDKLENGTRWQYGQPFLLLTSSNITLLKAKQKLKFCGERYQICFRLSWTVPNDNQAYNKYIYSIRKLQYTACYSNITSVADHMKRNASDRKQSNFMFSTKQSFMVSLCQYSWYSALIKLFFLFQFNLFLAQCQQSQYLALIKYFPFQFILIPLRSSSLECADYLPS